MSDTLNVVLWNWEQLALAGGFITLILLCSFFALGQDREAATTRWIVGTVVVINVALFAWLMYEYFNTYLPAFENEHPKCPQYMCNTRDNTVFKCGVSAFRYDPDTDPDVYYCSGKDNNGLNKYKITK